MRWWRWVIVAGLLAGRSFAATGLQKFTNVRLVENPSNDGDSFVVQAGERQLHLRLYIVDSPESVASTDADARKVFEYSHEAAVFTKKVLAKPFTIYTAFASARTYLRLCNPCR